MTENRRWAGRSFRPTTVQQCWGFIAGSALFAIGAAPKVPALLGAHTTNLMFFVGAWFFTGAGVIQWALAGPRFTGGAVPRIRADWLTAATQSLGTVLFSVSTGAAVGVHSVADDRRLVWSRDVTGSVAFLLSGVIALIGLKNTMGWRAPTSVSWWATVINFGGCLFFGLSAVGAYVSPRGVTADAVLANTGTCLGALCFLTCSTIQIIDAKRSPPRPDEGASTR